MGHDRGCHCGREQWDYRTCPSRVSNGGGGCSRESIIQGWDEHAARVNKFIVDTARLDRRRRKNMEMG